MRRRVLLSALLAAAIAVLTAVGLLARRTGTFSPNAWMRTALVALADAWLVPVVSVGGFSLEDPTTLALRDVALTADDTEIFRCERLAFTFRELPERGQPLSVTRIELDKPVLRLVFDPHRSGWLPRGFDPFLEPSAVAAPDQLEKRLQPREVLDLRLLRIRGGEVRVEDGDTPPLRLDGIDLDLDATPAVSPGGASGHQLHVSFGQPDGLVAMARGFVDLDAGVVDLAEARFSLDLRSSEAREALTEGFRSAVDRLEARGQIEAEVVGVVSWRDPMASKATLQLDAEGVELTAGPLRLPGIEGHLQAGVEGGRIRVDRANATVGAGRADLSRGDLALQDDALALAADWSLQALPLHELVAGGAASESVANGNGRLFLATNPVSLGLSIAELAVGEPGQEPTVALGPATVDGAVWSSRGDAAGIEGVLVDAVRVERVQVRLSHTNGGVLRGLPLPAAHSPDSAPAPPRASPIEVRHLAVEDGSLWVDRSAGPWRLTGIAGVVSGLGAGAPAAVSLTLHPGDGATAQGSGTLDLPARSLSLTRVSVLGGLETGGLRSLLPPENRSLVADLLPRGKLEAVGSADLRFSGGNTRVSLDATLTEGTAGLVGLRMPVSAGRARLRIEGASVSVEDVALTGARGTLDVPAARLSPAGALDVQWQAQGLDLERIRTVSGAALGAGRLATEGRLLGTVNGDALQQLSVVGASAVVDQGPAGRMRWPSLTVNLGEGDGARAVTARLAGLPGVQVDLEGAWPAGSTDLVVRSLQGTVDLAGAGRQALPVFVQRNLADLQEGTLAAEGSGVVSLSDPISASRLTGEARLQEGAYQWGDWGLPAVQASLPLALEGGTLSTEEGRLDLLSGAVVLTRGRWSMLDGSGTVAARLDGLRLERLRPQGPAASAIEGRLAGQGTAALRLTEEGLTVTGGRATATVRQGRLLSLPTLAALAKGTDREDGSGDDQVDLDMVYDAEGVTFRELALDLGPVRYRGGGEVRWTGGLDLALEADRSRKRLADLTARLVAWRVGGTTSHPTVQALPLGVDTRTFAQKRAAEGVDADALDALDEAALDALETASDRVAAPGETEEEEDDVEFNLDDFDGWK